MEWTWAEESRRGQTKAAMRYWEGIRWDQYVAADFDFLVGLHEASSSTHPHDGRKHEAFRGEILNFLLQIACYYMICANKSSTISQKLLNDSQTHGQPQEPAETTLRRPEGTKRYLIYQWGILGCRDLPCVKDEKWKGRKTENAS